MQEVLSDLQKIPQKATGEILAEVTKIGYRSEKRMQFRGNACSLAGKMQKIKWNSIKIQRKKENKMGQMLAK
ncbi:MAG: hypothetical protein RRY95_03285 [Oscillospiraceae bacterium]